MLGKFKRTKSKDLIFHKFSGILQACCKVNFFGSQLVACLDLRPFGLRRCTFYSICCLCLLRVFTVKEAQAPFPPRPTQGGGIHGEAHRAEHGTISDLCSVVYV
jgi:hypothetical protein